MRRIIFFLLLTVAFCAYGAEPEYPLSPVDISSPRATLRSFLTNCNVAYELSQTGGRWSGDKESHAKVRDAIRNVKQCMDLTAIPGFRRDNSAKESAVLLKEVLDRIEVPVMRHIPHRKDMVKDDGSMMERWTIPHTEISFQLIDEGCLKGSYQFSSDTVARAEEYFHRVNHLPYKPGATEGFAFFYLTEPGSRWLAEMISHLPESFQTQMYGEAPWQWVGLMIVLVGVAFVMAGIYAVGRRVSRGGAEAGLIKYILGLAFPILAVLVPIKAIGIVTNQLVISGMTLYVVKFNLSLLSLFCGMVVVVGIGRRFGEVMIFVPHIKAQSIDAQMIRVMSRLLGVVFSIVLLLQGGKHLGIPLSSLVAGAGVAGAALALSSQDVLKNIIGSVMILMDKPFVEGEHIKMKHYRGIVEEIGLRSTKIRMLNGHLAVIPNGEMAHADIENIGRRPFIRRVTDIPLAIGISSKKAKKAVEIVQELLVDHEGFRPAFPPRVWLNDFERDHLELRMMYWYHPADYWAYTAYADQVNRQILDAFETADIQMALPAFTTGALDQMTASS